MALGGTDARAQSALAAARRADAATLGMTYRNAIEAYTRGRGAWAEDLAGWQRAIWRRLQAPAALPRARSRAFRRIRQGPRRPASGEHRRADRALRREEALGGGAGLWLGRERIGAAVRARLAANPLEGDEAACRAVAGQHNPGNRAAYSAAVVAALRAIRADPRHLARRRQPIPSDPPALSPSPRARPAPPAPARPARPAGAAPTSVRGRTPSRPWPSGRTSRPRRTSRS